jgi:hypothetical protein
MFSLIGLGLIGLLVAALLIIVLGLVAYWFKD